MSQLWEPLLKVSLPVVNVPGASGVTGLAKMLAAPADGYTASVITGDTIGLQATGPQSWRLEDVVPLAVLIQQTSLFFIGPDSPYRDWAEVEEAARTRELKVAITGFGTSDDQTVNHYRRKGLKLNAEPFANPASATPPSSAATPTCTTSRPATCAASWRAGSSGPSCTLRATAAAFPTCHWP